jgi:hypothetical protein
MNVLLPLDKIQVAVNGAVISSPHEVTYDVDQCSGIVSCKCGKSHFGLIELTIPASELVYLKDDENE